jgi:hypothetical protein
MNSFKSNPGRSAEPQLDPIPDPILERALADFRQSVHAWSEAELDRPRQVKVSVRSSWRPALAWAMGCVVVAGAVSGGLYDHQRTIIARQQAQARAIQQQRELAEQQKHQMAAATPQANDESLLSNVDSDVSRSVPAAMEPLAQLMQDDSTEQ